LLVAAGVDYLVGREAKSTYGEECAARSCRAAPMPLRMGIEMSSTSTSGSSLVASSMTADCLDHFELGLKDARHDGKEVVIVIG